MSELVIGAYTYKAGRIDAMRQFDILRRLTPVMASGLLELAPLLADMRFAKAARDAGDDAPAVAPDENALKALEPVAKALAQLSDDDSRFIISSCMGVVERKETGGSWVKVWNDGSGRAMFQDIDNDLSVILKVVVFVLRENFESFFSGVLS